MQRQITTIITVLSFLFSPLICHAESSIVNNTSHQNDYSWELSDNDQKKVMAGMVLWGFLIAVASALLSGFIPTSASASSTTGTPAAQGSSLF